MDHPQPYLSPHQAYELMKYNQGATERVGENVIVEKPVSLSINGKTWLTFMCTPTDLDALAVGFLYNENIIRNKDEIANLYICEKQENIDIWLTKSVEQPKHWKRTSGCTGGYTSVQNSSKEIAKVPTNNDIQLSANVIISLVKNLFESQNIYKAAGGVHSSGLSDGKQITCFAEDVGRHNTLDKLSGKFLLDQLPFPTAILTTGRISSEMLQKAAKLSVPFLISRTSATSMSIALARELGITLIGYARGRKFSVYSNDQRISFD